MYTQSIVKLNRLAQLGIYSAAALCLLGLPALSQAQSDLMPEPTKPAPKVPDVALRSTDGSEVKLRNVIKGKNTVIVFYAGSSSMDDSRLQDLEAIQTQLDKRGYQVVVISTGAPQDLSQVASQDHLSYKLLSDSNMDTLSKFGMGDSASPVVVFTNAHGGVSFKANASDSANMKGADILKKIDAMPWPVDYCWY